MTHPRSELQFFCRKGITRIELLLTIAVLALLFGYLEASHGPARRAVASRAKCLSNLNEIGKALQSYLNENGNRWPYVAKLASVKLDSARWPTLPEALGKHLTDPGAFHCPADRRTISPESVLYAKFGKRSTYFETEGTSYEWWFGEVYGGKKVGEESLGKAGGFGMGRADQPLLSDFEPFHTGDSLGAINTLNADLRARTTRARPTVQM